MASDTISTAQSTPRNWEQVQRRHTIAAVVYFLYGLFYLFGAQYITTTMQASGRGESANSWMFFALGGIIAIVFPLLVYNRFAFAFSLKRPSATQRKTGFLSFTLVLGILVVFRVIALFQGGLYLKTPLHTTALVVAAITALCLLWAGWSQPVWVSREPEEG